MSGFSDIFSHYFYKHFPQQRGILSIEQQEEIQKTAEQITFKKNHTDVWEEIEANLFLLNTFKKKVKNIIFQERTIKKNTLFLLAILFLFFTSLMYLKDKTNTDNINILSVILNILEDFLKENGSL